MPYLVKVKYKIEKALMVQTIVKIEPSVKRSDLKSSYFLCFTAMF